MSEEDTTNTAQSDAIGDQEDPMPPPGEPNDDWESIAQSDASSDHEGFSYVSTPGELNEDPEPTNNYFSLEELTYHWEDAFRVSLLSRIHSSTDGVPGFKNGAFDNIDRDTNPVEALQMLLKSKEAQPDFLSPAQRHNIKYALQRLRPITNAHPGGPETHNPDIETYKQLWKVFQHLNQMFDNDLKTRDEETVEPGVLACMPCARRRNWEYEFHPDGSLNKMKAVEVLSRDETKIRLWEPKYHESFVRARNAWLDKKRRLNGDDDLDDFSDIGVDVDTSDNEQGDGDEEQGQGTDDGNEDVDVGNDADNEGIGEAGNVQTESESDDGNPTTDDGNDPKDKDDGAKDLLNEFSSLDLNEKKD